VYIAGVVFFDQAKIKVDIQIYSKCQMDEIKFKMLFQQISFLPLVKLNENL